MAPPNIIKRSLEERPDMMRLEPPGKPPVPSPHGHVLDRLQGSRPSRVSLLRADEFVDAVDIDRPVDRLE